MPWRSAGEPWHCAERPSLGRRGCTSGRGEGQATARVPPGGLRPRGGPSTGATAPAAQAGTALPPLCPLSLQPLPGVPVERGRGRGLRAARGQGQRVGRGTPLPAGGLRCRGAAPAPGRHGPRSLPGASGKCKGSGSMSQCPQVRSHLPQDGGTGSVAAVRGVGMDIQQHCTGEHGRGAAASRAPLEPIHDLLTSETQLRNSPSGKGTSLVGLEKDVVGAPAPRRGGGDVPGGQAGELGQLGSRGAEPPPRCAGPRRGRVEGVQATAPGPVRSVWLSGAERQGTRDLLLRPAGTPAEVRRRDGVVSSFGVQGMKPAGLITKKVAKWLDQKDGTVFLFSGSASRCPSS